LSATAAAGNRPQAGGTARGPPERRSREIEGQQVALGECGDLELADVLDRRTVAGLESLAADVGRPVRDLDPHRATRTAPTDPNVPTRWVKGDVPHAQALHLGATVPTWVTTNATRSALGTANLGMYVYN
jgi:hypothetical protein